MHFTDTETFSYIVLPLLIFVARVFDVSIGTLRIIFVSKGKKLLAPLLGFFEVLIWIAVIGKIMENLDNIYCYIGYAGGFAAGNYVGMLLEEKLAMGVVGIRVITRKPATELIQSLKDDGYGLTVMPAEGATGHVDVIYTLVNRKDLPGVIDEIKHYNPNAFYTIEDIKFVNKGVFPVVRQKRNMGGIKSVRKGK